MKTLGVLRHRALLCVLLIVAANAYSLRHDLAGGRFDLNISGLDTVKLDECIKSGKMADEISKDVQDANSYGVTGTPTFFINGYRLVGAQPLASFSSIIDQLLAAK